MTIPTELVARLRNACTDAYGPMPGIAPCEVKADTLRQAAALITAQGEALKQMARCFMPLIMLDAQQGLVGEPFADKDVALHFMGSGASDQVTWGEIRAVLTPRHADGVSKAIVWLAPITG